jgi:hypothetical protein
VSSRFYKIWGKFYASEGASPRMSVSNSVPERRNKRGEMCVFYTHRPPLQRKGELV